MTGQSNWWIIWREILPNALSPVIVLASLMVATAILLESSLSFLGLGDPNLTSERAYRLIVQQLPIEQVDPAAKGTAKLVGQVQVLITYKGSVFIRPRNAAPKLALDHAEPAKGTDGADVLALVLVNTGSAGARVAGCVVHLTAGGKSIDLPAAALAPVKKSRVFAGTRRRYLLPWPKALPIGPVAATGKCDVEP